MLQGRAVDVDRADTSEGGDAYERAKARFRDLVVPLCIPILAGPGSITTAMLYGARAESWLERGMLCGVVAVLMLFMLAVLLLAPRIQAVVGTLTLHVQTRLFGLILAAIAAQLIVEGLGAVFPEWVAPGSEIQDDLRESGSSAGTG